MTPRTCMLVCVCLFSTVGCAPYKPVVTNGASGTDVNNDRRADLFTVSRSNGSAATPHGMLIFPGSNLGYSVNNTAAISTYEDGTWAARVGDVNRDGFADFIVGSDSGSGSYDVRVFLGGATITQQQGNLRSSRVADRSAGKTMGAAAWDVNGDGAPDVVIVRNWRTVAVHFGRASGLGSDPDQTLNLGDTDPISDVRGVGDLDGDGFAEVALLHRIGDRDTLRIHRGTATGLDEAVALEIANVTGGVADRVDVDGDAQPDLVLGAIDGMAGCVHTIAGTRGPLSLGRMTTSECSARGAATLGAGRVLRAGDTNADGVEDVIVFEPGSAAACAGGAPMAFRVRLFKGTASGLEPRDAVTIDGPAANDCAIGVEATWIGDVHGDGYADIVIGVPSYRGLVPGMDADGRVYLYRGGPEGLRADGARTMDAPAGSGWGLGRFAR